MAKGLRSSNKKSNKAILRQKLFGPLENARRERLSAKLLELASQTRIAVGKAGELEQEHQGQHLLGGFSATSHKLACAWLSTFLESPNDKAAFLKTNSQIPHQGGIPVVSSYHECVAHTPVYAVMDLDTPNSSIAMTKSTAVRSIRIHKKARRKPRNCVVFKNLKNEKRKKQGRKQG